MVISVIRPRSPRSLAAQFLLLQLVVLGAVLAAVSVVTIQQSTQDFRTTRSSRMVSVAESLAATGVVRSQLSDGVSNARALDGEIARATTLSGARQVLIVDRSGTVVAASAVAQRDTTPRLGTPVDRGRSWTGDLRIAGRDSVAGQAPVLNDAGSVVGAILVAEEYPSWWSRLVDAAPDLLLFLGLAALLGGLGAFALSRLIRRQTRGLEPAAIARLADHQEALLRGIREGVVGVDRHGNFTVVNDTAGELLDVPISAVGDAVTHHSLPSAVQDFILRTDDSDSTLLSIDGRALLLNRRRALDRGRFAGTVTTFVDRSDLMALESRVAAQTSMTETLRAQTHEFDNRLHTISGLLQLGEYETAIDFVDEISRRRAEINSTVTGLIRDPRLAALIVAKTSASEEIGVSVHLEPESTVPRLVDDHAADVLTVLGNLVDNALDATRGHGTEISLRLTHSDAPSGPLTTVRVANTGPGIDPDHLPNVFERGWSTKAADATGRGIGLALVKAVCERSGGSVQAVHGDHGAIFTAIVGSRRHTQR